MRNIYHINVLYLSEKKQCHERKKQMNCSKLMETKDKRQLKATCDPRLNPGKEEEKTIKDMTGKICL